MNYFKRSMLFFVLLLSGVSFFCMQDASAMEARWKSKVTFPEKKTKVFTARNGERFSLIYDADFCSDEIRVAFSRAFSANYDKQSWQAFCENTLAFLVGGCIGWSDDFFCHAIRDEKNKDEIVAFMWGYLDCKILGSFHIDYLGTIPEYQKLGFAWQLIVSVFDIYPKIDELSLSALKSAEGFYKKHGFSNCGDLEYSLTREQCEKMCKRMNEKREKKLKPSLCCIL